MIVRTFARVALFVVGVVLLVGAGRDGEVWSLAGVAGLAIVFFVPLQWMVVTKPEWVEKITKILDR